MIDCFEDLGEGLALSIACKAAHSSSFEKQCIMLRALRHKPSPERAQLLCELEDTGRFGDFHCFDDVLAQVGIPVDVLKEDIARYRLGGV